MNAITQIKIEKNKPIPAIRRRRTIYPFGEMKVGDSFALPLGGAIKFPGNNGVKDITYSRLAGAAHGYGRKHSRKFAVRTIKDEGVVRCWRVA